MDKDSPNHHESSRLSWAEICKESNPLKPIEGIYKRVVSAAFTCCKVPVSTTSRGHCEILALSLAVLLREDKTAFDESDMLLLDEKSPAPQRRIIITLARCSSRADALIEKPVKGYATPSGTTID